MNIFPITDSFANSISLCVLILGIICFVIKKARLSVNTKYTKIFMILSAFLAFFSALYYFPFSQDISKLAILKLALVYLCYCFSFYNIITILCRYAVSEEAITRNENNSSYWKKVLVLGVIWSPNILIQYPASFCPDSISQLVQTLGYAQMTAHHPIIHTYLIGFCLKIGKIIFNSYNIGIFLYVLFQYFLMLFIFSYMIHYLERIGIKRTYKKLLWTIFSICPLIVGYTGIVLKDVLYSSFIAWFIICCVRFIHEFCLDIRLTVEIIVSGIGAILFRHNGIYVVLPTCILIFVVAIIKKKSIQTVMKGLLIILLPILFTNALTTVLVNQNNIKLGSAREIYSLCFQQTARTIIEHGTELAEDEITIIDNVLDYASLSTSYNPYISDPVKATYKDGVSDEKFGKYIQLWMKQFFDYPFTYVKATLQQNYALLSLPLRNQIYYSNSNVTCGENVITIESPVQGKMNEMLIQFYSVLDYVPFLNIICCSSFYCIMLFVLSTFCVCLKKWKIIIPLFPMWISLLICIASPAIINHPRYTFPIVYSMPFIYGYFLFSLRKEEH